MEQNEASHEKFMALVLGNATGFIEPIAQRRNETGERCISKHETE